jgi:hypothetical protein
MLVKKLTDSKSIFANVFKIVFADLTAMFGDM